MGEQPQPSHLYEIESVIVSVGGEVIAIAGVQGIAEVGGIHVIMEQRAVTEFFQARTTELMGVGRVTGIVILETTIT